MKQFKCRTQVKATCVTIVQDTSVHHYVTNPNNGALEPLLAPQIKYYRLSRLCGRSQGEKSFSCTNEGVFIAKGETRFFDCSTSLMTI